jgi:hypothetical protein
VVRRRPATGEDGGVLRLASLAVVTFTLWSLIATMHAGA